MNVSEYAITTEYIELNQLLKLCGHADSGGAGCMLVATGRVSVDGKQELRKRCKIRAGQVVRLGSIEITVRAGEPAAAKPKAVKPPKPKAPPPSPFAKASAPPKVRAPKRPGTNPPHVPPTGKKKATRHAHEKN